MNRSSNDSTGHVDRGAKRFHELRRLVGLRAVIALERQRQADDDPLGALGRDELGELAQARLARRALDDDERPRQRAGGVGDRDAGPRGAVVEREHFH